MVKIILEDDREINIDLFEEVAPETVANFKNLVENNYYDGVIFHRIIPHFVIQTGGFTIEDNEIVMKEHVKPIRGEFLANGFDNKLPHTKGVVSMARTNEFNSASSQFFICVEDCPHLDGNYAAFGKVKDDSSMAIAVELSEAPRDYRDFPLYPVMIKKVIIVD